jgi:hypothetical protein
VHLPTQFDRCHKEYLNPGPNYGGNYRCNQHQRPLSDCIVETLTFSLCGKYLLARNRKDVEVLHLPQEIQVRGHTNHAFPYESIEEQKPAFSSNKLQILQDSCPGGVLSGTHLLSVGEGSSGNATKALILTTVGNDLKVELAAQGSSANRGHLQLLSLPASFDASNTAVNLKLHTSLDDSLGIIFNKKTAQGYSLSGKEGQFSTIVERKRTSIVQAMGPASHQGQFCQASVKLYQILIYLRSIERVLSRWSTAKAAKRR